MSVLEMMFLCCFACFHVTLTAPTMEMNPSAIGNREGGSSYLNQSITMDIVFPDSFEALETTTSLGSAPLVMDERPKCARDLTFCEEIDSYPTELVKNAIRKMTPEQKKMFVGTDEDPMEQRLGEPMDKFVCRAIERTIYPKIAKNKQKKWKYLLNGNEQDGFVQGFRIEVCERQNGKCDLLSHLPFGYATSCKQKYIYRRFVTLSADGEPVVDTFPIPSACCCSYRRGRGDFIQFGSQFNPRIKR